MCLGGAAAKGNSNRVKAMRQLRAAQQREEQALEDATLQLTRQRRAAEQDAERRRPAPSHRRPRRWPLPFAKSDFARQVFAARLI